MDKEDQRKRVTDRHQGNEQAADLVPVGRYYFTIFILSVTSSFQYFNKLCEPIGEEEERALSVVVTADMTKDDVVNKILDLVK